MGRVGICGCRSSRTVSPTRLQSERSTLVSYRCDSSRHSTPSSGPPIRSCVSHHGETGTQRSNEVLTSSSVSSVRELCGRSTSLAAMRPTQGEEKNRYQGFLQNRVEVLYRLFSPCAPKARSRCDLCLRDEIDAFGCSGNGFVNLHSFVDLVFPLRLCVNAAKI